MGIKKLGAIIIALALFACVAYAVNNQSKKVYIVSFSDGANKSIVAKYGEISYEFKIFNAVVVELTPEAAEQLKQEPGVKYVEEDQIVELGPVSDNVETDGMRALSESAQTGYVPGSQWNLTEQGINAEAAWENFGVDGEGVKIAIIDSGVNYALPDLSEGYLGGYDFCPIGGGWDCYYNGLEDDDPMDEYGHGTEMATAIVGVGNTISGVAPQAKYYAIKITNDDQRSVSTIIMKGIEWAITNADADIIYIGIRSWRRSADMYDTLDKSYAGGKLFVTPTWGGELAPAAFAATIDVGAHNKEELQDLNSENGNLVEVVAPGEQVPVLGLDGTPTTAADSIGVATAQVTGVLALIIDFNRANAKSYDNSALRETLHYSALDLWPDNLQAGHGKTNANGALTWLSNDWFLKYKINYLDPSAFDREGTPIYYKGETMQYNIAVTNHSDQIINSKTINDLNVLSKQTIGGIEYEFFTVIPELLAGQTQTVGPYAIDIPSTFNIPLDTEPSTRNTQVVLKKETVIPLQYWPFSFLDESIIKVDSIAGTFVVMNKPVPQGTCSDSDNGVNPWVFGTCTDSRGTSISDASLPANRAGSVSSGKYVLETFCLTEQMREHCKLFNGEDYCDTLPNECYAAPLLPTSALEWTYFDRNDELYVCPYGSTNGVCNPCTAGWKCKDTGLKAYQNERCQWSEIKECAYGCDAGKCNACSAGWKCMDGQYGAYQSKDCGWSQVEYCSLGCESGKCRACVDSDNGVDPWVFGTCTDSRGTSISDASLPANRAGSVSSGKYVLETFCLTEQMREHCKLFNGEDYCDTLPNECYAAPLLPTSALEWTYFDRNDEAYVCPHGSTNGVCNPCTAEWQCKDQTHKAYFNERCQWSQITECANGCLNAQCIEPLAALTETNNNTEPAVQASSTPQTETEPEPQPAASPPAQDSGSGGGSGGGGGGSFSSNNKKISSAEAINESKDTAIAGVEENPAQNETKTDTATIAKVLPVQETQTKPEQETAPTVLPTENTGSPATGLAVLAQNALSALMVIVGGAIALCGKLLFK